MHFQLKPFTKYPSSDYTITGEFTRQNNVIKLEYLVQGNIPTIVLPTRNETSSERMGGLWETTCFELFLKNDISPHYLEFNFAPSGHWNCFSFEDYRQGMQEYTGLSKIDIVVTGDPQKLKLEVEITLKKSGMFLDIYFKEKKIKAGISAVIDNIMGVKSLWALSHTQAKPDFHSDDSFTLRPT